MDMKRAFVNAKMSKYHQLDVYSLWHESKNKSMFSLNIQTFKFNSYLIIVIFFTRAKFLENKIYTEKRHFFALNL